MAVLPSNKTVLKPFGISLRKLSGRTWEAVRDDLERYLRALQVAVDYLRTNHKDQHLGTDDSLAGTSLPKPIVPDSPGAVGNPLAGLASVEHDHPVTTAAPVDVGSANAEGSASSFSRSDHVHNSNNRRWSWISGG